MGVVVVLLLILVMVGFNALYVAAEFATVGSRRPRIQERAASGDAGAGRLSAILEDPKRLDGYVAACQIGITLSSLVAGAYGQAQLVPLIEDSFGFASRTVAIVVVLAVITTMQVVLGELLPKTVALRYPESLAVGTLAPMRVSQWLLRPLVAIFNGSAFLIMRRLRLSVDHSHAHVHSPGELAGLYRESAAGGLIDATEREMLAGALSVSDRAVREIMSPRRRLQTVESSTPVVDALARLSASPYSRFPVTERGEEIVGIVSLRELFLARESGDAAVVGDVAGDLVVVSELLRVLPLISLFSTEGTHAAIVVNEFGSVSGMVTREDALEEVLGEVNDEFDIEPDPIVVSGTSVSVRGDVLLEVLNERFDLSLPLDAADTINGYVWSVLGRVPVVGDKVPLTAVQGPHHEVTLRADEGARSRPTLRIDSIDGALVERATLIGSAGPISDGSRQ